jgi:hypothetical protein
MGLLAAGMAAGVATAMVLRRRRQQWEEYDATEALEAASAAGTAAETPPGGMPGSTPEAGAMGDAGPMTEGGPMVGAPPEAEADLYGTSEPGGESMDDLVSRPQSSRRRGRG